MTTGRFVIIMNRPTVLIQALVNTRRAHMKLQSNSPESGRGIILFPGKFIPIAAKNYIKAFCPCIQEQNLA